MDAKELKLLTASWGQTWLEPAAQAMKGEPPDLSSEARRHVAHQIFGAVRDGNGARARNWLVAGIALTSGDALSDPRLTDALRPSRYAPAELPKVQWAVSRSAGWAAQNLPAVVPRLRSFESYTRLFERVLQDHRALQAELHQRPSLLLLALSLAEERFQLGPEPAGWSLQPEQLQAFSAEDQACAVSYLVACYVDGGLPFDVRMMSLSPSWRDMVGHCGNLILAAHAAKRVRDAETRIYRFGYSLSDENGAWVLTPPSRRLGMALSHGFLSTVMQMQARQHSLGMSFDDAQSFDEFCDEALQRIPELAGTPLIRISPDPPQRLQIVMRDDLSRILSDHVLRTERFFREEIAYLADCCYELFADAKDLLALELAPRFTAHDLLRTVRLLRFYAWLRVRGLRDLRTEEKADIYLRSLLGSWPDLAGLLHGHGVPDKDAAALIALLSYDPGEGGLIDLQYAPILQWGGESSLLSSILLNSNTLRNAMVRSKSRVDSDGSRERLVSELARSLCTRFDHVLPHLRYAGGEIDVAAWSGGVLFVFECKTTLLPASAAEQRTFFDHIANGCQQLTRFQRRWESAQFRRDVAARTRWPLEDAASETCLVPSIRLLSGMSVQGHPIRGAHELMAFIETGEMTWREGEAVGTFDGYRGRGFTAEVLQEYLSEESVRFQLMWEATEESWETVQSDRWSLSEPVYGLNIVAHRESVRREFPLAKSRS